MGNFISSSYNYFKNKFSHSSQKKNDSIHETIKKLSDTPIAKREDIHQLKVIHQRSDGTGAHGEENCGFHAFRNAIVVLQAYAFQDPSYFERLYDQKSFLAAYEIWEPKIPKFSSGDRDLDVATLSGLLEGTLLSVYPPPDIGMPDTFLPIDSMLRAQDGIPVISIANTYITNQQLQFAQSGGVIALDAAANLWQVAHASNDLTHAFVVGLTSGSNTAHWVTMVLRQENGKHDWLMMDSYANQTIYTQFLADELEKLLNDSDSVVKNSYKANVEEIIQRRTKWVDPETFDVSQNYADDKNDFLKSLEFRDLSKKAFQFMKKCKWLENYKEHATQIKDLAIIVGFYANQIDKNDPDKKEMLEMHHELQLVVASINRST